MNAFSSAQRRHDNLSPEDTRPNEYQQRVCRCCGEWKDWTSFARPEDHTCEECNDWANQQDNEKRI